MSLPSDNLLFLEASFRAPNVSGMTHIKGLILDALTSDSSYDWNVETIAHSLSTETITLKGTPKEALPGTYLISNPSV